MGLKFRTCLTAIILSLALAAAVFAQNSSGVPQHTGFVNDYASVIDAGTKDALEKRLKDLRDGTAAKIEIGVLTVKTTDGKDIFDYSLAVAREWKVGSKEADNPGLLLVVAIDDRKYFTQVSRDAEGDIPDGLAGQIQRQYLVPAFKQGQYGKGIQDTVEAYIRRFGEMRSFDPNTLQKTEGPPAGPPVTGVTNRGQSRSTSTCLICGGIIAIIIFIFIFASMSGAAGASRRSSWSGGSFGGAGGRRKGSVGGDVTSLVIGGIIGSLLSGGGRSGGSGGDSGWGGGSSGGGDGGGWGGFGGGGDFGGGGAGGGW